MHQRFKAVGGLFSLLALNMLLVGLTLMPPPTAPLPPTVPGGSVERCATPILTPEEQAVIELQTAQLLAAQGLAGADIESLATSFIVIPVVVHVLHNGSEGQLTLAQINQQIDVMNAAFNIYAISFTLDTVTYTNNNTWFTGFENPMIETAVKNILHQNTDRKLNIYTVKNEDYLGWATFPWWLAGSPSQDGVVVDYRSLPGIVNWIYGEGDTAVHEVGHWLGLYHTFQGGCGLNGDFVADTPAISNPHYNCVAQHQCAGAPPPMIENFMDYTPDSCMDRFTNGQRDRMFTMTQAYRPLLFVTPVQNYQIYVPFVRH